MGSQHNLRKYQIFRLHIKIALTSHKNPKKYKISSKALDFVFFVIPQVIVCSSLGVTIHTLSIIHIYLIIAYVPGPNTNLTFALLVNLFFLY